MINIKEKNTIELIGKEFKTLETLKYFEIEITKYEKYDVIKLYLGKLHKSFRVTKIHSMIIVHSFYKDSLKIKREDYFNFSPYIYDIIVNFAYMVRDYLYENKIKNHEDKVLVCKGYMNKNVYEENKLNKLELLKADEYKDLRKLKSKK